MGISREAGSSFCAVVHARIKAEGTMMDILSHYWGCLPM